MSNLPTTSNSHNLSSIRGSVVGNAMNNSECRTSTTTASNQTIDSINNNYYNNLYNNKDVNYQNDVKDNGPGRAKVTVPIDEEKELF